MKTLTTKKKSTSRALTAGSKNLNIKNLGCISDFTVLWETFTIPKEL
jgi:hypothetical protein